MRAFLRLYLDMLQHNQWLAWCPGVLSYLSIEDPFLELCHPDGKFLVLLTAGFPLSGIMSMAWVRWSALLQTVPHHETIEEHP